MDRSHLRSQPPLLPALTSRLPPKLANLPQAASSPHISADICKKNPWVDSEPLNSKSPDHRVIFSSDILINGMSSVSFSILVWVKLFLWPETAMSAISNHNQSFKPVPVWLPISVCTFHNPSSHHKPMQCNRFHRQPNFSLQTKSIESLRS